MSTAPPIVFKALSFEGPPAPPAPREVARGRIAAAVDLVAGRLRLVRARPGAPTAAAPPASAPGCPSRRRPG